MHRRIDVFKKECKEEFDLAAGNRALQQTRYEEIKDELKTNKNLHKLLPICFPTAGSLAELEVAYILDREDPDVWELP